MIDDTPVITEQTLPASRDAVWAAITDPSQMRRWYFEQIEDFQPEVGHECRFTVDLDGKQYRHVWRVTRVVPGESITYSWEFEGLPGHGHTSWELSEVDGQTHLKLTNDGLHTFPQDDPAFTRESCEAGWRYFLNERLLAFFAEAPPA